MAHSQKTRNTIRAKLRVVLPQLAYWPRTARLIWQAAPGWTAAWAVLLVLQGLLPVAIVCLSRPLVNSFAATVSENGQGSSTSIALLLSIALGAVLLLTQVLQTVLVWVRTAQSEFVQDHISALIHQKSAAVDLAFYESAEYYDRLHRARNEASTASLALLESAGSLLQYSITLIGIMAVLVTYGIVIPVVLLLSTVPAFIVVLRFDQRYYAWWERTTSDRRWSKYYDLMLTEGHMASELRLYDLGSHFQNAYQRIRGRLRGERLSLLQTQSLAQIGAGVVSFLIAGAALGWMAYLVFQGTFTLGDLALFYQAFDRGQMVMQSLLNSVGQLLSNSLFLSNLYAFLDLTPQITSPLKPLPAPTVLRQGVTFQNVTFHYPGSQHPALHDFNLAVPAGQIAAIVGTNGAGKSTLIKLLARFYDPDAGAVMINGTDIRHFTVADVRQLLTVLFQFPTTYQATAHDNIALGSLTRSPSGSAIEAAARNAGAHDFIARLPDGYDTLLGKWLADGAELSGGEWQRVATARAYLREAQIVVLDEPTSFMDSWAEADWFERFRAMMQGRTGIIITHRFTIAMRADVIHVMDAGRIIESGTHHELLASDGSYAQSWHEQMRAAAEPIEEQAL